MKHLLLLALFWTLSALPLLRGHLPGQPAAVAQATLTEERRELAAIRLLVGADRKFAAAKERLAKLKTALAGKADAKDLLAEVATLEQEVLRALGEAAPATDTETQDKVDEAVLEGLLDNRYDFIGQLGTRAAPGLMKAVRKTPEEFTGSLSGDPFYLLLVCDPMKASDLCQELLTQGGFFWRKRVLRAMENRQIQQIDSLWSVTPERRYLAEGLLKTLEKYVDDPDVGGQALRLLASLVYRGATSSVFEAAVARSLRSQDPARRADGKAAAKLTPDRLRPLLETLLREKDDDLRGFAAGLMAKSFPDAVLLLDHADDPSVEVRTSVAYWLERTDWAAWGERERAALARLLHDTDSDVRKKAWALLNSMPTERRTIVPAPAAGYDNPPVEWKRSVTLSPLSAEVYRSLLTAEEREMLPQIVVRLDAPVCFPLLEVLAADPRTADEVADVLDRSPCFDDVPAALAVAAKLLEHAPEKLHHVRNLLSYVSRTKPGLEALVPWLLRRGDAEWTNYTLVQEGVLQGRLQHLDPELVAAIVAQLYPQYPRDAEGFVQQGREWTGELNAAFLGLARDAAQPLGVRIVGLRGALVRRSADAEFLRVASAVLQAPEWRGSDSLEHVLESFDEGVLRSLYGETRNALVLQVVSDPKLEALVHTFVERLDAGAPHADEIVKRVLEHWSTNPGAGGVNRVLLAMADNPALQDREVLARAARDPSNAYSRTALGTIGRLRDPSYLPLLAEIVETSDANRRWATEALFGYLDEEAVEPLLLAATKASFPELRDQCLAQLEKIREYQEARARWATRKVQAATRAEVVAELLELLDAKSTETRVQAIRGLATWEAVEAMPRLIALVADPSKDVAAAAREALARLNTPKGE